MIRSVENVRKYPFLGDIPIIGSSVQNKSTLKKKRES